VGRRDGASGSDLGAHGIVDADAEGTFLGVAEGDRVIVGGQFADEGEEPPAEQFLDANESFLVQDFAAIGHLPLVPLPNCKPDVLRHAGTTLKSLGSALHMDDAAVPGAFAP